jgi:hypothetical protein
MYILLCVFLCEKDWHENSFTFSCYSVVSPEVKLFRFFVWRRSWWCTHGLHGSVFRRDRPYKWHSIYIVDSDIYLNNTYRTHCCLTTATVVTRTHNNVTFCIHHLSLPTRFQGLAEQEHRPVSLGSLSFGMQSLCLVADASGSISVQQEFFLPCLAVEKGLLHPWIWKRNVPTRLSLAISLCCVTFPNSGDLKYTAAEASDVPVYCSLVNSYDATEKKWAVSN